MGELVDDVLEQRFRGGEPRVELAYFSSSAALNSSMRILSRMKRFIISQSSSRSLTVFASRVIDFFFPKRR